MRNDRIVEHLPEVVESDEWRAADRSTFPIEDAVVQREQAWIKHERRVHTHTWQQKEKYAKTAAVLRTAARLTEPHDVSASFALSALSSQCEQRRTARAVARRRYNVW